ncbi:MAG TPA: hypothetical protein VGD37_31710 [Kofleriaceae bacterium]
MPSPDLGIGLVLGVGVGLGTNLGLVLGVGAGLVALVLAVLIWRTVRRRRAARPRPIVLRRPGTSASEGDILASLGIGPGDGELQAACTRVARRIHNEGVRVVGFVPAADSVAVPPILIHLGIALTELTGATIAVVDANVRYPGLGALNQDKETDSDESVFSTRWLRGSLALLSPPQVERAGEVVPQLARVLLDGSDLFAHVLVDLTGFELLGEHASAAACMDAVALVGRAHHTREQELFELARLMPHGRFFGVLLVG